MGKFSQVIKDTKEVIIVAKNYVVDFFVGLYHNAEGVIVLSLASIGLSALLGELPFWVMLPAWVESPMVIPVISVLIVYSVVKLMERRQTRVVYA